MHTPPEAQTIRALYRMTAELTRSEIPVVRDLAIAMLGNAKLLVAEILPDEFEHVRLTPEA
ncbi:MAG: hypothetical protein QOJ39_3684 [Candidatus Eremiobacteraeota bacterium]|nr:hypothetical protein [Candidatus Eremiobacteraeota bacterium]MEA2721820.1 hypothetical protein [Candidatus Eremiobacteraeota bacterium]